MRPFSILPRPARWILKTANMPRRSENILRVRDIIRGELLQGGNAAAAIYARAFALRILAANVWAETLYPAADMGERI